MRPVEPCPFHGTDCEYVPLAHKATALEAQVSDLRAENERLREALTSALTFIESLGAADLDEPIADGGVTCGMGFQAQAQTVYAPRIRAALKGNNHE